MTLINKQTAIIFHIDFDSYFVSALRTIYPHLKNQPVACSKNVKHAIAVSVSYELKKLGISAGTKIYEIKAKVPNARIVPANYKLFNALSNNIFSYLAHKYTNLMKVCSIDECYLDVSNLCASKEEAIILAGKMQQDILKTFDIPITIGISNTFFAAKMTTNLVKPFGIGYTDETNFQDRFWELPIEYFHGIGKQISPKLRQIGINSIKDFASKNINDLNLQKIFGRTLIDYFNCLNINRNDHIYKEKRVIKGIGKSESFTNFPVSEEKAIYTINQFAKELTIRMQTKNLVCKNIAVGIRTLNKNWEYKQKKLPKYTDNLEQIQKIVKKMFIDTYLNSSFRGIAVRLSELENKLNVFEPISLLEKQKKQLTQVDRIIENINDKLKAKKVYTLKEFQEKQKEKQENSEFLDNVVFKRW
ncbi:hypothetical protein [Mycoplasma buteonis]|uniref:Y-family DNA polymerase n=1 Tax=Mycoplasma buteonis TaxID=171280 RepID=UPI00068E9BB9|nr:hypothetical protein [Mycoplasma buteonis]